MNEACVRVVRPDLEGTRTAGCYVRARMIRNMLRIAFLGHRVEPGIVTKGVTTTRKQE